MLACWQAMNEQHTNANEGRSCSEKEGETVSIFHSLSYSSLQLDLSQ